MNVFSHPGKSQSDPVSECSIWILVLAAAVFIIDGDIDVAHFAKAKPVKRAVQAYLKTAPKGLKTFLKETGFRPLRDLNRIQIRMKQPINEDQPGEPLITLKGRFKPQRIHSSWAKNKNTTFSRVVVSAIS